MTNPGNSLAALLAALSTSLLSACASQVPVTAEEPIIDVVAGDPVEIVEEVAPPPIEPPQPDKSALRITIANVGDMMIGTDYPRNRLPDDDGAGFLAEVAPWLASADLTIGNLEGVLVDGGTPGKKCSNPNACYLFRSPTRYAQHYVDAGFDVLSLANNHARDFGEDGRTATMATLERYGILHTGRVGTFAVTEVNGLSIAVLGYAVTRNSNMLLDYRYAEDVIGRFADEHDIVVVTYHAGAEGRDVTHVPFAEEEYYGEPRGDVVRFSRMAVDAGADLVIGHGPHVVRGIERYNDRIIAYSLGNFATYYGISVSGIKGVAPILLTTLDGNGQFIDGEIVSTEQLRPAGPTPDPRQRAFHLMHTLSLQDFGEPGLQFLEDGRLLPATRTEPEVIEYDPDTSGDGGPVPCTEPWHWLVETIAATGDGMGHGPDMESLEWRSVVEFKLGLRDDPDVPELSTTAWCGYVDEVVREALR